MFDFPVLGDGSVLRTQPDQYGICLQKLQGNSQILQEESGVFADFPLWFYRQPKE
jgi:hypothetical protein